MTGIDFDPVTDRVTLQVFATSAMTGRFQGSEELEAWTTIATVFFSAGASGFTFDRSALQFDPRAFRFAEQ